MFANSFARSLRAVSLAGVVGSAALVGVVRAEPGMMQDGNNPAMQGEMHNDMHAEMGKHVSGKFAGVKANAGTVTHEDANGKQVLTLSDDFVVPQTPAPHWQVVDSNGNVYLLNRLQVDGDKYNKTITLPSYIQDVAKVQIWCAYAEVLLGEASFEKPVK